MKYLDPREEAYRRFLNAIGYNDYQIGRMVGRDNRSITNWRHQRGIPANRPQCYAGQFMMPQELRKKIYILYGWGLRDTEIGRRIGLTRLQVKNARKKMGLDNVYYWSDTEVGLVLWLWTEGWSFPEIGRFLGRKGCAVRCKMNRTDRWDTLRSLTPRDWDRIKLLYDTLAHDDECNELLTKPSEGAIIGV